MEQHYIIITEDVHHPLRINITDLNIDPDNPEWAWVVVLNEYPKPYTFKYYHYYFEYKYGPDSHKYGWLTCGNELMTLQEFKEKNNLNKSRMSIAEDVIMNKTKPSLLTKIKKWFTPKKSDLTEGQKQLNLNLFLKGLFRIN